jgi:hypothetical protein
MIRVLTTPWSRWRDALGLAGAVGLACLAAVAGEGTPVREKIQFSGSGDASALPSSRPKEDLLSKPFEFLDRGNSVSGVVAPALAPAPLSSYQRNSRMLELFEQKLDRKRNWIFGQPTDFGRTPTAEEVFNIGAFGGAETKPKTALENYLAGSGPKPGRGHTGEGGSDGDKRSLDKASSRFDRDDRSGDEASSPLTNPYDSSRIFSAGFSLPNEFLGKSAGPARLNDFLNTAPANPGAKARDDRKHAEEFRKLLNFSGPANPLATGLDLHPGLDTTRQEWNPITAPRLGELPGTGHDAFNPLGAINGPPVSRFNGLDEQTAKMLGPSSLAPAVSAPVESPTRQPTPTVSEFPKRRF